MPTRAELLGFAVQPCRTCKRPIFFAEGPNGRPIPLDASAAVYTADLISVNGREVAACQKVPEAFVTHFSTCPDASKHSKRGGR